MIFTRVCQFDIQSDPEEFIITIYGKTTYTQIYIRKKKKKIKSFLRTGASGVGVARLVRPFPAGKTPWRDAIKILTP